MDADVIVIGAGVVGAALAYGIAKQGHHVVVLDGEDRDLRAARANFGLIWVQGKGADAPAYNLLSRHSSDLWPEFLQELTGVVEMGVDYSRPGGLVFCVGEAEYAARAALNKRMHNQSAEAETEMIQRGELDRMLPAVKLGPDVVGASYCKLDGHVNPLQLLAALHRAILALNGLVVFRNPVEGITPLPGGFTVRGPKGSFHAKLVIVAAGLATPSLTEPLGLSVPLRSERGQLLVTERFEPILPFPASGLRQTADGTVMIGATKENATDRGVSVASATELALERRGSFLHSHRRVSSVNGWVSDHASGWIADLRRVEGLSWTIRCGLPLGRHPGRSACCNRGARYDRRTVDPRSASFSNGRFDVQMCA